MVHEEDLLIDRDREIGCGAFARVFLAELRGPSCTGTGRTLDKGGSLTTKVAVKQARSTTEQARSAYVTLLDRLVDNGRRNYVADTDCCWITNPHIFNFIENVFKRSFEVSSVFENISRTKFF